MFATRNKESYSMEFKCKVISWYLDNKERHRDSPNIKITR